jgi:heme-degrading monooxygenase HmoA
VIYRDSERLPCCLSKQSGDPAIGVGATQRLRAAGPWKGFNWPNSRSAHMIKVLIRREVPKENQKAVMVLINELRATIVGHPGYLSSETLKRVDPPGEILVISKWQSDFYWKQWYASQERKDIQSRIDELMAAQTRYDIYEYD